MADEKLKQELFYMVKLTTKYDFTKMEVVEGILRLENERQILGSVFGKRFKARIFDIAAGQETDGSCVICGQLADNHVICQHCIQTISESNYAKSKTKPEEKKKISFSLPRLNIPKLNIHKLQRVKAEKEHVEEKHFNVKLALQSLAIVCLTLILFCQIGILALWHSMPDYNPKEKARDSAFDITPVSSKEAAYNQLILDFPESEGYTVTYARTDYEYVGRFLLDKGACCAEIEDNLTEKEMYDYYFQEEVYVFY
ncbi:MAG: hypothetical protein IJ675_03645, partial [Pseudobutyrivibrio sp.]|nr:hypothetical protein [Pseudobutyrivibrio sp.]